MTAYKDVLAGSLQHNPCACQLQHVSNAPIMMLFVRVWLVSCNSVHDCLLLPSTFVLSCVMTYALPLPLHSSLHSAWSWRRECWHFAQLAA